MAVLTALSSTNITNFIDEVFGESDITTSRMQEAIRDWYRLYYDAPDGCNSDPTQRVPYIVVDGLNKAVFGEYEYSVDEDEPNGKQISAALKNLEKIRSEAFQQACIGGDIFIKPIIHRDNFTFTVIPRGNMYVLARNAEKHITDLVTEEIITRSEGQRVIYFRLFERRTLIDGGFCVVQNKLYRSENEGVIGSEVSLTALPEYTYLEPEFVFPVPLDSLGLIPVRMPMVNSVDGSKDGVSIYAAAAGKIDKLYSQDSRANNEWELTEPHMVVDKSLQQRDEYGNLIEIPKYITPILEGGFSEEKGLGIWNPKPNQPEIESRDDQLKREIENIIGLRRGFLSKAESQEFTATEILSTSTKMAHLVEDLQDVWDSVVTEAARICVLLADIYQLQGWTAADPPEVTTDYGNGILYDEDKEFTRLNLLTTQGKLRDEYLLGWYFNMPTKSLDDLQAIRDKYMPQENIEEEEDIENR